MQEKIEEQKVLLYDPTRCTGCHYCELACSLYHFRKFSLEKTHLHIQFDPIDNNFEAIYCFHCEKPVCVASCPSNAAFKDEKTGFVRINSIKCIGCRTCTFICPLSVPWFNKSHRIAMKCDFCDGDPQCTKVCSPRAIRITKRKEAWDFNQENYSEGVMK